MYAAWPWPSVFAHRCGGALAPENTLAGLDAAARWGCRAVEFDVMLSADASPLLIHDETLERTSDGHGLVALTPDRVLRALDAGAWFDAGFAGERIPTLDEAARRCSALGLAANVEIKPAEGMEAATGRVVAARAAALWQGAEPPPLLSSFSEAALEAAAEVAPGLPRGLLVEEIPPDWAARCARLAVVSLHARAEHIDAATARAVRAAGLWLVAYTEDDVGRAGELRGWGVNAIITDRPDRFSRVPPHPAGTLEPAPCSS